MSIISFKNRTALQKTINDPSLEDKTDREKETMSENDGILNTIISFNCKRPAYFFKHGDASDEFKKIKYNAELEELQQPIDMQIAKNYLESAFTGVIGLHREIDSAIEAGQADGMLEHFKSQAKKIEDSFETFCRHLNIKMMFVCPDADLYDEPGDFLFNAALMTLMPESLEQLQAGLELMIHIIKFTCERGCGEYANNTDFHEFEQYCSFITSCLNYKPLAA